MTDNNFHYFASSCLNWTVDTTLEKCLKLQRLADTGINKTYKATTCCVYKVPLPVKAHYEIDNYRPQVEGTEFLDKITY